MDGNRTRKRLLAPSPAPIKLCNRRLLLNFSTFPSLFRCFRPFFTSFPQRRTDGSAGGRAFLSPQLQMQPPQRLYRLGFQTLPTITFKLLSLLFSSTCRYCCFSSFGRENGSREPSTSRPIIHTAYGIRYTDCQRRALPPPFPPPPRSRCCSRFLPPLFLAPSCLSPPADSCTRRPFSRPFGPSY